MATTRARLVSIVVVETALLGAMLWLLHDAELGRTRAAESPRADPALPRPDELATDEAFGAPDRAREAFHREATTTADATTRALVYGRVVDPEGKAVSYAEIRITDRDGQPGPRAHYANGEYAVFGLASGTWQFRADARGFKKLVTTVEVASGEQRRDLELAAATVVHVHAQAPDGTPMRQALNAAQMGLDLCAVALTAPLPAALPATPLNLGEFGVGRWMPNWGGKNDDRLGDLELQIDPPVHVGLMLGPVPLAQQLVAAGTTDIVFQLPLDAMQSLQGGVQARIVNADKGTPLERANSTLSYGNNWLEVSTDPAGQLRATIAPGLWTLQVAAEGYQQYVQRFQLDTAQQLDLGTIALATSVTVRGHVIAPDGRPARTSLMVSDVARQVAGHELLTCNGAQADAGGAFTLLGLGRGVYAVQATIENQFAAWVLVDTTKEVPEDLRIELQPVRRVVLQNRCPPDELCVVSIHTSANLPVWGRQLTTGDDASLWLPRGEYVVDVYRNRTRARTAPLVVGDTQTTISVP